MFPGTSAHLHREGQFFPAGPHAQWDSCTVGTEQRDDGRGDALKTQEPHLNEQLLFHLKIFHLSKKIKAFRQSTKYFDVQQIK